MSLAIEKYSLPKFIGLEEANKRVTGSTSNPIQTSSLATDEPFMNAAAKSDYFRAHYQYILQGDYDSVETLEQLNLIAPEAPYQYYAEGALIAHSVVQINGRQEVVEVIHTHGRNDDLKHGVPVKFVRRK